jgi:hypothetical protein
MLLYHPCRCYFSCPVLLIIIIFTQLLGICCQRTQSCHTSDGCKEKKRKEKKKECKQEVKKIEEKREQPFAPS